MEKRSILRLMLSLPIAATLVTGCVDDSYDLSDINTDVEIKVNDLVVPINLDAIQLSDAFDLDENSVIKEIDGEYAVVVDGRFHSKQMTVDAVSINPGSVSDIEATIYKYDGMPGAPSVPVSGKTVAYEVTPASTGLSFSCSTVDGAIRSLSKIKGQWLIDLDLKLSDLNDAFEHIEFQQLVIDLPAGMHVANYPCSNGKVEIGHVTVSSQNASLVSLSIDEIDFTKFSASDFTFTPGDPDADNGHIEFNGKVGVYSGYVIGALNSITINEPQLVKLTVSPILSTIDVKTVSGNIRYAIDGFDAADVTLSDLPDMLRQEGTDISIANPQLYLAINNPTAQYGLTASSGMTLTAYQGGDITQTCSLDAGQQIKIGTDKGNVGPYMFCLSPRKPENYYGEYQSAIQVGFSSFSRLLSGEGLPDYIHVTFDSPVAGPDDVNDFVIGQPLDAVEGNYTFYAPLELSVGSKIVYQGDEKGWDDETVSKITVTSLKVKATVTNTLPADIVLSGNPLNAQGDPCVDPKTGRPVSLSGFRVPAGATAEVELVSDGTITGIDGIRYTATCHVTEAGKVLRPDQPIELTNIRATVSGYYRDTL